MNCITGRPAALNLKRAVGNRENLSAAGTVWRTTACTGQGQHCASKGWHISAQGLLHGLLLLTTRTHNCIENTIHIFGACPTRCAPLVCSIWCTALILH